MDIRDIFGVRESVGTTPVQQEVALPPQFQPPLADAILPTGDKSHHHTGKGRKEDAKDAADDKDRKGVFVTTQSLVTFPVASAIVNTIWKLIGLLDGAPDNRWVALGVSIVIGGLIYAIHATDPKSSSTTPREHLIDAAVAAINTVLLWAAALGISGVTSGA